jgi:hypothetical protein
VTSKWCRVRIGDNTTQTIAAHFQPSRLLAIQQGFSLVWSGEKLYFGSRVCAFGVAFSSPNAIAHDSFATSSPDAELADFRLDDLQAQLERMPLGPERDNFAGLLANRRGQNWRSIELLRRALPGLRAERDARASVALKTLADDYTKIFDYSAASKAYDELFALFPEEKRGGTLPK